MMFPTDTANLSKLTAWATLGRAGRARLASGGLGLQVTVFRLALVPSRHLPEWRRCLDYLQESQCQGCVPCGALPGWWFTYRPRHASWWLRHTPQRGGEQSEVTKAGARKIRVS